MTESSAIFHNKLFGYYVQRGIDALTSLVLSLEMSHIHDQHNMYMYNMCNVNV